MPLVSVLVPAFNHASFVEEAIRSVLAQSYARVELVVVDDCSTDPTVEVVERLAREHGFTFLRNETNLGLNATLEKALAASHGEYVSILSSDDTIFASKLEEQVEYLRKTGRDGVYANGLVVRDDTEPKQLNVGGIEEAFADGSILDLIYCRDTDVPLLQSALIRRDAFEALAPHRRRFKSDDWITLIKLLEDYEIGFMNKPLFTYRIHSSSTHRDYWSVLPMRLEVVASATPKRLRSKALANIFFSMAEALRTDGKRTEAIRFVLGAVALDPSPRRLTAVFLRMPARALRRSIRKLWR